MLGVLLLSADVQSSSSFLEWQNVLMCRFYADIPQKNFKYISKEPFYPRGANNFCSGNWVGITCDWHTFSHVVSVYFHEKDIGTFRIHELPPRLEEVVIIKSKQRAELILRQLPRELVTLSLSDNRYYGHLKLDELPQKLCRVYLQKNHLWGPIWLYGLPEKLLSLHIQGNKIEQNVVWYDKIPDSVQNIQLQSRGEQKIGKVCAKYPGQEIHNKAMFTSMSKRNVE